MLPFEVPDVKGRATKFFMLGAILHTIFIGAGCRVWPYMEIRLRLTDGFSRLM